MPITIEVKTGTGFEWTFQGTRDLTSVANCPFCKKENHVFSCGGEITCDHFRELKTERNWLPLETFNSDGIRTTPVGGTLVITERIAFEWSPTFKGLWYLCETFDLNVITEPMPATDLPIHEPVYATSLDSTGGYGEFLPGWIGSRLGLQPVSGYSLGWKPELAAGLVGGTVTPPFRSMAMLELWCLSTRGRARIARELRPGLFPDMR